MNIDDFVHEVIAERINNSTFVRSAIIANLTK